MGIYLDELSEPSLNFTFEQDLNEESTDNDLSGRPVLIGQSSFQLVECVSNNDYGQIYHGLGTDGGWVFIKRYFAHAVRSRLGEIFALRRQALGAISPQYLLDFLEPACDGDLFAAFPYLQATSVRTIPLTRGSSSGQRLHALRLADLHFKQAALTVEAMHVAGVCHGDISPRNWVISQSNVATLIDLDSLCRPGSPLPTWDLWHSHPEVMGGACRSFGLGNERYAVGMMALSFGLPPICRSMVCGSDFEAIGWQKVRHRKNSGDFINPAGLPIQDLAAHAVAPLLLDPNDKEEAVVCMQARLRFLAAFTGQDEAAQIDALSNLRLSDSV